ncbi:carboxylating nicotinate-nucleotide diphosphorylase [Terasakiella sp. A23]|uniref:carboxylating nicotinate-nucleotide diphosphorylase n=1 Tax=Terasakiella sp. FCG-A23 TaxID=3080561 RepID=UPI002953B146|nr:carboxylating nicotinate-nucleotide diphosphorylase [Terasakiella sp. A23]MDV7339375.1 carboxylating nicotinate-nucleotide diphosphorylase [Terasakiella sp. A23]
MSDAGVKVEPLSPILIEPSVRAALAEDLGRGGDLTTDIVIDDDAWVKASINARQVGAIAGIDIAEMAFDLVDPRVDMEVYIADGGRVEPGDTVAILEGPARAILTGERVALNYLGHLSGIASETRKIVDACAGTKARITCTRKTTPGLRAFEKYAVRCGGGFNHRFGLDDGLMIKDNHIAACGGITQAVERAKSKLGHMVKINLEVDTLEQLEEGLKVGADVFLLDNMGPDLLKEAVKLIDGRGVAEASGGVTLETAPAIAASGVDIISIGWLTHSAPCLDLGMDF